MENSNNSLTQLWQQRKGLNQAEWGLLFQFVSDVLKLCNCSELKSLPLDRSHYINDFFYKKVFLPSTKLSFNENQLFSNRALVVFFCRYLRRVLNEPYAKRALPILDDNDFVAPDNLDDACILRDVGKSEEYVKSSAREFLLSCEEWVRLYLEFHTCAEQAEFLPLKKLADVYKIPAYHYRARRLGISRKKGEFEKDYDKTILGQWLVSLSINIDVENQDVILIAFKILCREVLSIMSITNKVHCQ